MVLDNLDSGDDDGGRRCTVGSKDKSDRSADYRNQPLEISLSLLPRGQTSAPLVYLVWSSCLPPFNLGAPPNRLKSCDELKGKTRPVAVKLGTSPGERESKSRSAER